MDELTQLYALAYGGGGLMNIIVGVVTQFHGPSWAFPVNYILGGFLLGMFVMQLKYEGLSDTYVNAP